jgi:hypothetical protein
MSAVSKRTLSDTLRRAVSAWQVGRVRKAYTRANDLVSERPGYVGMVDEMRRGLAELADTQRRHADDDVLNTIFFGGPGLTLLAAGFRRWPKWTARTMARASVEALRFLVGPIEHDDAHPTENHITRCEFRAAGGEPLCRQVCREPTERFCNDRGIPVRLEPDPDSLACRWTWGRVDP